MAVNNDQDKDIAGRIKKIRASLNLNQKEMSKRLNISQTTLSELESGNHMPKFETLYNLASEFNVNLYYLFFGQGDMFLDSIQSFTRQRVKNMVNKEEVERFLYYFENSNIAQLQMLSSFLAIYQKSKEDIEREIAENRSKE